MSPAIDDARPILVLDHQSVATPLYLPAPFDEGEHHALTRWLAAHGPAPSSYQRAMAGEEMRCSQRGALARRRTTAGSMLDVADAALRSQKVAILALHPHDPDANRVLQDRIGYLLARPVGRPPNEVRRYYANFRYQAGTWNKPRRVIAKVEWHPSELYPRVGFIVTNMARPAENVVAFYNKRGTCEQWIKEGKGAIKWTRLSCTAGVTFSPKLTGVPYFSSLIFRPKIRWEAGSRPTSVTPSCRMLC